MSGIRFAASLVEDLKDLVIANPASVDETRGLKVYGPLKGERGHMVLVLVDEGVDLDSILVSGYKFPLPVEVGHGFLADIKEFPIH